MRWETLADQPCSMARTLAVVGDRWTLMILRDAFLKVRRFDDFQKSLGLARRVLSERLALLVGEGVLEKRPYQDRPMRHEYRLTDKGLDLYPAVLSLVHWGDKYYAGDAGPPILHHHKTCGHDFHSVLTCSECGKKVKPKQVTARANLTAHVDDGAPLVRRLPTP